MILLQVALTAKVLVRELRAKPFEASHQFLQQGLHQGHSERERDIGLLPPVLSCLDQKRWHSLRAMSEEQDELVLVGKGVQGILVTKEGPKWPASGRVGRPGSTGWSRLDWLSSLVVFLL